MEESGIGACSLACNIIGGRGACWSSEMGLGRMTSTYSLTRNYTKPNNKLVNALLEHFWCQDKPRVDSNSQDSPRPKLGGSHHLPLYIILCASPRGPHPNGIFVPGLSFGSLEIPKVVTPTTLGPNNFVCKPLIEMRSKTKLQPSSITFQRYVACHLNARKSGRFPTFSGRKSNCQFDSRPFFWP